VAVRLRLALTALTAIVILLVCFGVNFYLKVFKLEHFNPRLFWDIIHTISLQPSSLKKVPVYRHRLEMMLYLKTFDL
jgi:hypothetical protein